MKNKTSIDRLCWGVLLTLPLLVLAAAWRARAPLLTTREQVVVNFAADAQGQMLVIEGLGAPRLTRWRSALGDGEWGSVVRVFPAAIEATASLPPTAGVVSRDGDHLRFRPRYGLEGGLRLRVELHPPAAAEEGALVLHTAVPALQARPRARVTAVYPTSSVVPANQLKIYIHFSAPMETWHPYDYLRLEEADTGRALSDVFHTAAVDLWDPSATRFTVLFDPSRIKRGLRNHRALGAPLAAGQRYRLVVSGDWPDARGVPIGASFSKTFVTGPPDRARPNPAAWRLRSPPRGTRAALVVELAESLDHALLAHALVILDPARGVVPGRVGTARGETVWTFEPLAPWRPGRHVLRIDPHLEDLAGNNLRRLFDTDLASPRGRAPSAAPFPNEIPFVIAARLDPEPTATPTSSLATPKEEM